MIVTQDLGDFRPLLQQAVRAGTKTFGLVCVPARFPLSLDPPRCVTAARSAGPSGRDAVRPFGLEPGRPCSGPERTARLDLESALDSEIFQLMQLEQRVIVTNNHRHFAPLANAALQAGETFHGLIFTSDRSLPRTKRTIPVMVELLDQLLKRHRHDETLPRGIEWLAPRRPDKG